MEKISKISAHQWAQIEQVKLDWLKNTNRQPDRSDIERAVGKLYQLNNLDRPKIIHADSPLSACIILQIIKAKFTSIGDSLSDSLSDSLGASLSDSLRDSLWDSLSDSLRDSLRASLWASLSDSLGDSLSDSLRASLRDSLRASLSDSLGASLSDSLWASLSASLSDSLRASLRDSLSDSLWASLWASLSDSLSDSLRASLGDSLSDSLRASLGASLSLYWHHSYCGFVEGGKIAGVVFNEEKYSDYQLICKNISYILPFENLCIVAAPPIYCEWGDNGEISSTNRAAVEYKDGFKIYAIDGYRVPESVVLHPNLQTIDEINNEQNEEAKRIRIERFGWDNYLTKSGATVLDFWKSPNGYLESLMRCGNYTILCTYDPSTGRPYSLEVDPVCQTCADAQQYLLAPDSALAGLGIECKSTYPTLRT